MRLQVVEKLSWFNKPLIRNLTLVTILLYVLWLYFPPYSNSFIGDDYVQFWRIRKFIISPQKAYQIFNPLWTDWYFRPLQNLWFLANRLIFQLQPLAYYYLQLILHLVSATFVFALAKRLQLGNFFAIFATIIFAAVGHFQLTVAWISSIGNVLSSLMAFGGLVIYITYLQRPKKERLLFVTTLVIVVGILGHELGIILPLFLLGLRTLWPNKRRLTKIEASLYFLWMLIIGAYIYVQISRPNANVAVSGIDFPTIRSSLSPIGQVNFISTLFGRWFGIRSLILTDPLTAPSNTVELAIGIALIALLILLLIYVRSFSLATMVGIYWLTMQVALIYFALWLQGPELVDSRHIYSAWAGLSLFVAGLFQYLSFEARSAAFRNIRRDYLALASIFILAVIITFQFDKLESAQQAMVNHLERIASREMQLKKILPAITDDTRVYAKEFDLTAPYFAPVAAIWYDNPQLPGGSLTILKQERRLTDEHYLFDTDSRGLYNLMPELQQYPLTYLLARRPPVELLWLHEDIISLLNDSSFSDDQVVGPNDDRRLAFGIITKSPGWVSAQYTDRVPYGSKLAFAILGQPGQTFRIRLVEENGNETILFEQEILVGGQEIWHDFMLPVNEHWGRTISLFFELSSFNGEDLLEGYWSNPRFVLE